MIPRDSSPLRASSAPSQLPKKESTSVPSESTLLLAPPPVPAECCCTVVSLPAGHGRSHFNKLVRKRNLIHKHPGIIIIVIKPVLNLSNTAQHIPQLMIPDQCYERSLDLAWPLVIEGYLHRCRCRHFPTAFETTCGARQRHTGI